MGRKRIIDDRQMSLPFEREVETYCAAAISILKHAKPVPVEDDAGTDSKIQFNAALQEVCKDTIKQAGMSRAQVLDKVNAMFGWVDNMEDEAKRPTTIKQFDNYLSKPEVLITTWLVYGICAATQDLRPIEHLVGKLGGAVIGPEERMEVVLGKLDRNIRACQRLKREVLQQMRRNGAAQLNTEDLDYGKSEQGEETGGNGRTCGNSRAKRG